MGAEGIWLALLVDLSATNAAITRSSKEFAVTFVVQVRYYATLFLYPFFFIFPLTFYCWKNADTGILRICLANEFFCHNVDVEICAMKKTIVMFCASTAFLLYVTQGVVVRINITI